MSLATVVAVVPLKGQQSALTADDYARAEKFMSYNTAPLVLRAGVRPTWLEDGRFWYRVTTENGSEAFLVDPATGAKTVCDLAACKASDAGTGRGGRGGAPQADVGRNEIPSPDRKRTAFVRDHNLWVRDLATKHIFMLHRVIIDVDAARVVPLKMVPIHIARRSVITSSVAARTGSTSTGARTVPGSPLPPRHVTTRTRS